ncbi:DUF1737 domain-containing protein [Massilia sp. CMS3.1]|uniref:DUF1737 domain-containing protein n=1 Tax=Massilia sp. CMS3.1 TaxID=3373083 RepID=UPI003EE5EA1B
MEYMIARGARQDPSEALESLEQRVNEALNEGWRPIGTVSLTFFGDFGAVTQGFIALQAMIKDAE